MAHIKIEGHVTNCDIIRQLTKEGFFEAYKGVFKDMSRAWDLIVKNSVFIKPDVKKEDEKPKKKSKKK